MCSPVSNRALPLLSTYITQHSTLCAPLPALWTSSVIAAHPPSLGPRPPITCAAQTLDTHQIALVPNRPPCPVPCCLVHPRDT